MHGSDADDGSGTEPPADGVATGGVATEGENRRRYGTNVPSLEVSVGEAAAATPTVSRATLKNADRAKQPNRTASILVAIGPGPHSGATVDLARRLAEANDAWLELFHVVTEGPIPDDADPAGADADSGDVTGAAVDGTDPNAAPGGPGESDGSGGPDGAVEAGRSTGGAALLESAQSRIEGFERADRFLVEGESAAAEIAEQSPYYDLVVVGASTTGTVGRFVFGCTTDSVVDDAEVPVVVVESDEPTPLR